VNHATPTSRSPGHLSSLAPDISVDSSAWTGRMHAEAGIVLQHQPDYGRAAFVVHLDAPWGGGKTTFANFLARVMNPYGFETSGTSFLRERYGDANIGLIFLQDPPLDASKAAQLIVWPEEGRRPWVVVQFNAWRVEHCEPPWWVFYQTIREQCLTAVRREGITPVDPRALEAPKKPQLEKRLLLWFSLWIREYWWRLKNPKVKTLLSTALIGVALIAILHSLGIIHLVGKPEETKPAFNVGDGIGLMFAGITAISAIWGIGALITESIVPGTNTLAERLSLGSGDPFERFRRHFYQTMERLRRPVMVIIDDLDRCKPGFVVDLIRGIQTLLRSPRVVFVILGDRDWIERAFETHHKEMSQISVGPEQTFGARFVEKAVQMSFVLPGVRRDRQNDYVRRLLLGDRALRDVKPFEAVAPRAAAVLRDVIQQAADVDKSFVSETEQIRRDVGSAYQTMHLARHRATDSMINQFINDELAIRAAGDEEAEQEIAHRLDPLTAYLPPNPRQIKRIINSITMYHAVALQREGMDASDPRWLQLVLWVILMTEWPRTWRLLASFPLLIELIKSDDVESRLKDVDPNKLPGAAEATLKEIKRIKSDSALMALIAGSPNKLIPGLDRPIIEDFLSLTPIYGRKAKLSEEPHVNGEAEK
jgi:KAP family P-loop domain